MHKHASPVSNPATVQLRTMLFVHPRGSDAI
jgi:hypothetical protein